MRILSLFDGISCARVALERAGFTVDTYYASEVDKYAIQIAQKNFPDTIQLGDVRGITKEMVGEVDLLIGGSPCQDLSIAKKDRKGLDGEKSGLFWEYVRILQEVKPKRFILENVNSMPKEAKQIITETLGVEPIMINASLVSAQNRKRLFWTNIPQLTQPEDRGIMLRDIIEGGHNQVRKDSRKYREGKSRYYDNKSPTLSANMGTAGGHVPLVEGEVDAKYFLSSEQDEKMKYIKGPKTFRSGKKEGRVEYPLSLERKSLTILTSESGLNRSTNVVKVDDTIRKITPIECERLQGLPDNYTEGLSNTQRYKCLGNAFNVDVVAHIVSFIPTEVT